MARRPVLLLVEDNAGDASLASEALDSLGIDADVAWVNDGEEAMRWMQRHLCERSECPRLILLDMNLPRMNGHEFLNRLRSGEICERTPVIVFSSSDREQYRQRSMKLGILRYVVKPRVWNEYLAAFRSIAEDWRALAG